MTPALMPADDLRPILELLWIWIAAPLTALAAIVYTVRLKAPQVMKLGEAFRAIRTHDEGAEGSVPPATSAALHPVHHEEPEADQYDDGQEQRQQRQETRLLLLLGLDVHALGQKPFGHVRVTRHDGRIDGAAGPDVGDVFAIQRGLGHFAVLDVFDEI